MTLKDIKNELLQNGFRDSYPLSDYTMIQYTSPNGNEFDIYLDIKKPNRVNTLRLNRPNTILAEGLIGEFVCGKAPGRRFSFKNSEGLKIKLNKLCAL